MLIPVRREGTKFPYGGVCLYELRQRIKQEVLNEELKRNPLLGIDGCKNKIRLNVRVDDQREGRCFVVQVSGMNMYFRGQEWHSLFLARLATGEGEASPICFLSGPFNNFATSHHHSGPDTPTNQWRGGGGKPCMLRYAAKNSCLL